MTALERIRNTVAGRPADRLPVQPILARFAAAHAQIPYIDYTKDGRKLAAAQLKVAEESGIDCLVTMSDSAREVMDIAGSDSIDWTIEYGPVVNPERAALLLPAKLREFRTPDPFTGGRMHDRIRAIEILRSKGGAGQSVVGWIEGPMSLAAGLRGMDRLKEDLKSQPSFASDLLDFTAEVAVRFADAQIRSGADTVAINNTTAAILGPEMYETWLFPRCARILEAVKQRHPAAMVRLVVTGQVEGVLTRMAQLPIDVFQFDSMVDLTKVRAWLGQGRVLVGNVSGADLMNATPRKVYESARKCHRACGAYHVVGTAGEVPPSTPPENLRALISYARENQPGAA